MLSACFRTHSEVMRDQEEAEMQGSLQESVVIQSESMERLQSQVGKLQGRIEELEHERRNDYTQGQSNKKSLEEKTDNLEKKLDTIAKNQDLLFEEMKKIREERLKEASRPSVVLPIKEKQKKNQKNLYDEALKAFNKKKYNEAADGFSSYLKENPRGKYMLSANYYLGESLYQEKSYADAILALSVVQEKSLKTSMGRKATLRIAESFRAMGKTKEARSFAQILIDSNPGSAEAKKAKRYLR